MIIVLKQDAPDVQVREFCHELEDMGLQINDSKGSDTHILGLIGDTKAIAESWVLANPVVETCRRVSEPYKKANRKFHPDDSVIDVEGVKIGGGNFAVIAGPCSIESEEQITYCAQRVKAAGASLLRGECEAFRQRGAKLSGLDVYISSNVPKGSGVSSSAAFEVLVGVILNDCFMDEKVSPIAIAQIGQWAENVYFGKPCGLMDQMASSVGNIITIDFADPAHPDVEPVAVDFSKAGLALCILDSCADHADLTDEYAAVPAECRAVAAVCGGEVLRDVPFETFLAKLPECRKQCGDRAVLRAFHIYADNDRVAKQVAALREGDFDTFLRLVNESGHSSWEYLQNVIPAGYKEHQEMGVTIAAAKHYLNGKGAVRVHGGGFAGTAQAFVPVEMLADFKAHMEAILGEGRCHVLSIRPEGGAVL